MAFICNDRVKETTASTGTGTISLAGAVTHFDGFNDGIGNSNTTYYCIVQEDTASDEWEVGYGVYTTSGSTLTRTAVTSSNGDALVDFAAGNKAVFCTLPASKGVIKDTSGNLVYGDGSATGFLTNIVSDTTPQLGGDLDVNGNAIVSVSNGAIAINANGTGMVTMTSNSVTGDVIPGKMPTSDLIRGLLLGQSTTGTLSTAADNLFIGTTATALTSGDGNIAIGNYADAAVTNSNYNVAVGYAALEDTNADCNTAVGTNADKQNSTGVYNTSLGEQACEGVHGNSHSYNTAIGAKANELCTTGGYNVTLGAYAGDNMTTAEGCVIIGSVDAPSATAGRQLMITGNTGIASTTWWEGNAQGAVINDDLVHMAVPGQSYGPTASPKTMIVTVAAKTAASPYFGDGDSNCFFIDGVEAPALQFGGKDNTTANTEYFYKFDSADSTNVGHPVKFYLDANKATAYTTGVTVTGTAGSPGANTIIKVDELTPNILYYECGEPHDYMGNYTSQVTSMINANGIIYKWPTADGSADYVMTTDGAGVLSFAEASGGGASWQAVITADPSPAVVGNGYFCNTTSGVFDVTLPASPSLGDTINFIDYAGTFDTNNLTVARNGKRIQGVDSDLVIATERAAFALVYSGATDPGWLLTEK